MVPAGGVYHAEDGLADPIGGLVGVGLSRALLLAGYAAALAFAGTRLTVHRDVA
jgi:hypothetical protein